MTKHTKPRRIDGLPVYDAKRPISITVTAKDVANAKRKSPGACVAALAAMRGLHAKEVRVHLGRVYVRHTQSWLRYETKPRLRNEIIAYDRGGTFEPGEYDAPPPSVGHRAGERGSGRPSTHPSKRRRPHFVANVRVRATTNARTRGGE
jgi:hypothetical protein